MRWTHHGPFVGLFCAARPPAGGPGAAELSGLAVDDGRSAGGSSARPSRRSLVVSRPPTASTSFVRSKRNRGPHRQLDLAGLAVTFAHAPLRAGLSPAPRDGSDTAAAWARRGPPAASGRAPQWGALVIVVVAEGVRSAPAGRRRVGPQAAVIASAQQRAVESARARRSACGLPGGSIRSWRMPSLIHQTPSSVRPTTPLEAKGRAVVRADHLRQPVLAKRDIEQGLGFLHAGRRGGGGWVLFARERVRGGGGGGGGGGGR